MRRAAWKSVIYGVLIGCCSLHEVLAQNVSPLTNEQLNEKFAEQAEIDRQSYADMDFESFKRAIYKEPFEGGQYIVNGDTPIPNDKALLEFYQRNVAVKPKPREEGATEFAIGLVGGVDAIWPISMKHALSYCVSKEFGERHQLVVEAMEEATNAWQSVAELTFHYLAHQDSKCTAKNEKVVFDVRPVNVVGAYWARAFRPNFKRKYRNLLIDESTFALPVTGKMQLVGVLRHELGHVIGARHEHTRPRNGPCFEDDNFRAITTYDAFSVMHYPKCNGKGDRSFQLTARDKAGASCVYGPAEGAEEHLDESLCLTGQRVFQLEDQVVKSGEQKTFAALPVKPGTELEVRIKNADGASGFDAGDADLYLNFDQPPHKLQYVCKPGQEDANEKCDTVVPAGVSLAHIMVLGLNDVTFDLTAVYVAPQLEEGG